MLSISILENSSFQSNFRITIKVLKYILCIEDFIFSIFIMYNIKKSNKVKPTTDYRITQPGDPDLITRPSNLQPSSCEQGVSR